MVYVIDEKCRWKTWVWTDNENPWNIRQKKRPKTTENDRKRPKTTTKRPYCVLTASLPVAYWFRHPVQHLELSTNKGIKKARETSDMVRVVANGEHEGHEDKNAHEIWKYWTAEYAEMRRNI